jgi:hypothetical protein
MHPVLDQMGCYRDLFRHLIAPPPQIWQTDAQRLMVIDNADKSAAPPQDCRRQRGKDENVDSLDIASRLFPARPQYKEF